MSTPATNQRSGYNPIASAVLQNPLNGQEIAAAQQRLTKDLAQRQFASLQVVEMIKGGLAVEADKVIPLVRALHTFLTEQQPA